MTLYEFTVHYTYTHPEAKGPLNTRSAVVAARDHTNAVTIAHKNFPGSRVIQTVKGKAIK